MRFMDKMIGVLDGFKEELLELSGYKGVKLIYIFNFIELLVLN